MVVVEYREIFPLSVRPKTQVKEFEGEEKEVAEVVKAKVFEAEAVSLRGDLLAGGDADGTGGRRPSAGRFCSCELPRYLLNSSSKSFRASR